MAKPEIIRPRLGMSFSGGERNHLFVNRGGSEFITMSGVSGVDDLGDPRGFAYLDYDRDGWVDILLARRDRPSLRLFRNNLAHHVPGHQSVAVRFVGGNRRASPSHEFTARDGYGAVVTMELGYTSVVREHRAGEGWRTQNSPTMLVGIGEATQVERLIVRWPSGKSQVLEGVLAGSIVTAYENEEETADGSGFEVRQYSHQLTLSESSLRVGVTGSFPLKISSEAKLSMYISMATWCQACRREIGNLSLLRREVGESSLAMFGVPVDPAEDPKDLQKYASTNELPYELLSKLPVADRVQYKDFMRKALHTDAFPATVIVGQDGTPVYIAPGTPTLSQVRALLE